MGSKASVVGINEAVFFLAQTNPALLDSLRRQYPNLEDELQEGIYAGVSEVAQTDTSSYLMDKARFALATLEEAARRSKAAQTQLVSIIRSARRRRMLSQCIILFGSSSVLGATALDQKIAAVVSGVLTLLAALGNLFAEYQERLLNPQSANVYEAFQKLAEGTYQAEILAAEIRLAVTHNNHGGELVNLIGNANSLCSGLNTWLVQLVSQLPRSPQLNADVP